MGLMQIDLTEEQSRIKFSVREFAEAEIAPHVMTWDEPQQFPLELQPKLAAMGLMGILIPEAYGGSGLGYAEYVTIIEELARVDPSVALGVAAHNSLGTNHIFLAGTEAQRQAFVPPLARGEQLSAWALTEPGSGSDAAGLATTAVRQNGYFVLNGNKNFITHASYADTCVVLANTDHSKGTHGISAFIVPTDTPGFVRGKKENKLGMRASDTASLAFVDLKVPAENLLGRENEGFVDALKILDGGRISIAALSVGIAQGAYEAALRYAKERHAFGRPIAEFQATQWKLADMATQIEAARLLTWRAALLKDAGKRTTCESAMAKLYASEVAVRVAEEAIQIHGGYGYTKEYPVEKFWRDAKLCTIGEGTSEIQRLVIAREILQHR